MEFFCAPGRKKVAVVERWPLAGVRLLKGCKIALSLLYKTKSNKD